LSLEDLRGIERAAVLECAMGVKVERRREKEREERGRTKELTLTTSF